MNHPPTLRFAAAILLGIWMVLALPSQAQMREQTSGSRTPAAKMSNLMTITPGLQRPVDFIVAVVNSEPVTNNEVLSRAQRVEQQLTQQNVAIPPRPELLRELLERIISEKAQLQMARELGLRIEDNAVVYALQNIALQNQISVEELRRRLIANADEKAYTQFRNDVRDELLLTRLREQQVDAKVKVTESEVDQLIAEQVKSSDSANTEIDLAQILIVVPENATPAQLNALQGKAQSALNRARAGEDFGTLVKEFSGAPDRAAGGQMGLRSAERYPSLFIEATQNVSVGGLSGLVRSEAGFHILKVLERKQTGIPGAILVQTHARHILLRPSAKLSEAAAKARLLDFKKRIGTQKADFATLARENSQDGSAAEGGDLGWANPGMFVPEFEEVMNRLAPGQIADPLVSRFGVHLIQVLERRQVKLSAREQREMVRNLIREKKNEEQYTTWAREVRGRAYVEYRDVPR